MTSWGPWRFQTTGSVGLCEIRGERGKEQDGAEKKDRGNKKGKDARPVAARREQEALDSWFASLALMAIFQERAKPRLWGFCVGSRKWGWPPRRRGPCLGGPMGSSSSLVRVRTGLSTWSSRSVPLKTSYCVLQRVCSIVPGVIIPRVPREREAPPEPFLGGACIDRR